MTTEPEETVAPQLAAWEAAPYIQWGIEGVPYSAVRVPLSNDPKQSAAWIGLAMRASKYLAEQYAATFPESRQRPQERPQQPQRQQGGQRPQRRPQQRRGGGQGKSRVDRFERYEGDECDICGGPVGIYPMTGNMRSDKLVCLGTCKDGEYVHTVRWLDDDQPY